MDYKLKKGRLIRHAITTPFLWILIIPLVLLDIFTEMYHQIGFRLCGIPLVKRSEYIVIDRHKLKYLSWFNKIACAYCGYANGFAQYLVEIGARTEKYWCAIKHKKMKKFKEPEHHKTFLKYGDGEAYKKKYVKKK